MRTKSQKDMELIKTIKVCSSSTPCLPHVFPLYFTKSRGVTLNDSGEGKEGVDLTGDHPAGARVHLASDGSLVWPVLLLYPEYSTSDYIREFRESDRFADHLNEIFKTPAPWDVEGKYTIEALQVGLCYIIANSVAGF